MTTQSKRTVAFALCGSFCSFAAVLPQLRVLTARGWDVLPVLSASAAGLDTRFGTASALRQTLYEVTGHRPLTTLQAVEPLGPQPSGRQPAALHARAGHTRPLPGGIVSQRAAAYSPLIRPCGVTFPPRGKARGISTPLYAAFPPAYYSSSGWICTPRSAASNVSGRSVKSLFRLQGFL